MLNVHASGGVAMLRAAAESARQAAGEFKVARPLVLGVTVLTSLDRRALEREVGVPSTVERHVVHLAYRAREAGLDGCVASPQEIRVLRLALGPRWVIVTPGVRPSTGGAAADDQARTATPAAAIAAGADYLVVGRPITQAPEPAVAARTILAELAAAHP
jgi:orotidine-5'-phosphate decarboxylase